MTPPRRGLTRRHVLALPAALTFAPAFAQTAATYPDKPIKIILPYTSGGTSDVLARSIGQKLTDYWGQPVVMEYRPGAAGWTGMAQMAKMAPDGYTVGLCISSLIYAKSLYSKLPFDFVKDFEPVSMVSRSAIMLVVRPDFPARTLAEYVAHAKKNPGKLSYASFGQGTTAHIFGETLNLAEKLDLVHVAYKGTAPIITDLLGGQIASAYLDTGSAKPLLDAGRIRAIATSGTQRVGSMNTVPTFLEQGYKGFEPVGFFQILAPAKTPPDIVRKLSEGIARAIRTEDIRARMIEMGQEPVGSTAEELATAIRVDGDIFDRAIKASNIKVEQPG